MNHSKFLILLTIVLVFNNSVFSQNKPVNRDKYRIHITETSSEIVIDGIFDEEPWMTAEHSGMLHRVTPVDTGLAIAQTDVRLSYDKTNLYMAVVCYDPSPGIRPIQSLRRDFNFNSNDNFMVFIDTYNDQTNGFAFGVSAAGVQRDGVMSGGNNTLYSWDTKWKSAVRSYDDRWEVEISIPFRSLRYFDGATEWGINFGRFDLKTNEKSAWGPMPRQFTHSNLAFTGTLLWDKPLKKTGLGFSVIPYVTAKATHETGIGSSRSANGGFDTKMILSTSMNLDLTVNPDYSQVEEDQQVTNLDRFELFFPERRQFFLENSDLFSGLGRSGAQPFFSRRVGLNAPVIAGGRLSGQIGDNWRIGLMDMQTGNKGDIPASNFAVAVLQRNIFSRSNIVAFLVNKQLTDNHVDSLNLQSSYSRVAGLEYNMASTDDKWTGKVFYHQAMNPGLSVDASAASVSGEILYSTPLLRVTFNQAYVGSDFIAEAGYVKRRAYLQSSPGIRYTFYPSGSSILSHGPSVDFDLIMDTELNMTDRETQIGYTIGWQNRNQVSVKMSDQFVKLNRDYDPTNTGGTKLLAGSDYNWKSVSVQYTSDSRKLFYYTLNSGFGSYYNGSRLNMGASVNYRVQPYGSIALTANYNNISLPDPYNSAKLILVGPRLDVTFTDKLFLTTFVQYNNQIDNVNTNIRLQWRFAPVSDLFIVYTGNSYIEDFKNRNRGIVVKFSYWFN